MAEDKPPEKGNFLSRAEVEIKEMGKQGLDHPSSQPVLLGMFIGAMLGSALSGVGFFLGAIIGALFALYLRLERED